MDSERRSQRYPSNEPLQLRCETWREFVDTYANDICRGGMFIRSDRAPEVLSNVELRLALPEGTEIAITARVVHVVTPEQAEQFRHVAGMGVEFIHTDAEQKRQILQLVEFARTHGDDPNASWTRTLLENSTAMPTRDVAARLSMMPEAGTASTSKSRTNMPAVQPGGSSGGSSPANAAVRPRGQSVQLDANAIAAAAARSPSAPIRTATAPVARPVTGAVTHPQTGPVTGVTRRSSATHAAVRAPTGPVTGVTARSNSNNPIVRTPTGPVSPSGSSPSNPAARSPSGPVSGKPSANPGAPSGPAPSQGEQPQVPPQPTDLNRLKLVLNSLSHKHYEDAARLAREMLADNPGDPQVLKWQAICFARIAITRNDPAGACENYAKALTYDENNREARDYVRSFQRDQKLNALPFGRYFMKKK